MPALRRLRRGGAAAFAPRQRRRGEGALPARRGRRRANLGRATPAAGLLGAFATHEAPTPRCLGRGPWAAVLRPSDLRLPWRKRTHLGSAGRATDVREVLREPTTATARTLRSCPICPAG